ncbi:Dynamitin-domain-containing protein [Absidia repens]|uniref:Dynamitin-domain-containing protein n=1 Tax=Absidia repens TaxID=90262 RepID=A0A1X2I9E7_9FUNG|nr:Dynamitin-domain-containing protein [Absidia repens]
MSKYATLPDIDDQPDVYETPEATEGTLHSLNDNDTDQSGDDDTDNLVRTRISHQEASDRFKNGVVDSHNTDFSDQLGRRKKALYRTYVRRPPALDTDEYEILPRESALEETQLQKFRRLTFEVEELSNALDTEDKDNAATKSKENQDISQAELMSQITYLQNDLGRLYQRFTDNQQNDLVHIHSDPVTTSPSYGKHVNEAKSLIKQLEAYKALATAPSTTTAEGEPAQNTNENSDAVTYELYYTPEAANAHQQGRVVDIDERIAKIEKLVGTSSGQGFDSIPSSLATTSLIHSLSKLEQQISLLAQPRQLDTVSRRIKVLNSELERLHELKTGGGGGGRKELGYGSLSGFSSNAGGLHSPSNTGIGSISRSSDNNRDGQNGGSSVISNDTEEKVSHLFATMEKVDPLLNLTPALLTRLKALQGLHTEAATFGQSVKVISDEQTRMTEEIKSLDTTCELLTKSLKNNEDLVNKNVDVIDTRMTDLVRRMEALCATTSS